MHYLKTTLPPLRLGGLLLLCLGVFLIASCEDEETFDFGPLPSGMIDISVDPVNTLLVTVSPVGVDTSDTFVSWDFGFADNLSDKSNLYSPSFVYPEGGTYTITLILTNSGGVDQATETITVEAPPGPVYTPQEMLLAGDEPGGKTWRVAAELVGHSAASRVDGSFFWQRDPGVMECLGLYNDVYTFDLEDFSYTADFGGDIYTRAGLVPAAATNPVGQAAAGCPPGLSGNDVVAEYTSPADLSWSLTTRGDGQLVMTLPDGGVFGMGVGQTEYEVLRLEEDLVEMKFLQAGGVVFWHVILVPLEGDFTPDELALAGFAPTGKTWRVAKDVLGHSAASRESNGTFFWQRDSCMMECLGLYNDRYTFKPGGGLAANYGGDIYTRAGLVPAAATNSMSQAEAGCPAGLSGNDVVAEYPDQPELTWELSEAEDGTKFLNVSENGYLGMAVGQLRYELLKFSPDTIEVKFLQEGGVVFWHKILVPGG